MNGWVDAIWSLLAEDERAVLVTVAGIAVEQSRFAST